MKKTARLLSLWMAVFLWLAGDAFAQAPMPIAPGAEDGAAVVISGCPTFSWSDVTDAISYQVAVFESAESDGLPSYGEMASLKAPVLRQNIPDRGFSWTPSANGCLIGGTYVWYVAAVDAEETVEWSAGEPFRVDALTGAGIDVLRSKTPVSEIERENAGDREPERRDTAEDDKNAPSSLEQIISAAAGQRPLPRTQVTTRGAGGIQTQEPVTVGTEGASNTFYGFLAGNGIDGSRIATFIGVYAGRFNTSGNYNTFIGGWAGYKNLTGNSNTFLGVDAGSENLTGSENTFMGDQSGYYNTVGDSNTFLGKDSGYHNKTGDGNTFAGVAAGRTNSSGRYNTFIGTAAGYSNYDGSNNVFIGYLAGYHEDTSNNLYIANTPTATPLIYGNFEKRTVKIHGQLQMVSSAGVSDLRLKRDIQPLASSLDKVKALQGVSFHWRTDQYPQWGFRDNTQIGLVAQDVEAVIPELVHTDAKGYKAVSYDKLAAVLVEAVKELKAENQRLETKLNELRELIGEPRG